MKAIVIYDSVFGNTEKVAQEIGKALSPLDEVEIARVGAVTPEQLKGIQLVIFGSPTRGFRPTPAVTVFIKALPADALRGVWVTAFDTRISTQDAHSAILSFMVKIFGYADRPMVEGLKKKGGKLALSTEGFFVQKSEGPLKDGELERAGGWARRIDEACKN